MADGKIEIEIELDDSGVKKQSQTAGKQAGSSFKSGFEGSSKGSTDKTEEEMKSAGKSAGSSGKSAGKKFKDGFESATKGIKAPDVDTSKIASAGKTAGTAFGASFAAAAAAGMAAIGVANEYQEDMGKLTVSAQVNNVGIDQANASYREMVGILGEVDQSVEAVNHLFTLTQGNTEQLSDWTTIASGVYASFGDSLPLEGLTEAANESARVGQVVGPLADALNWASLSAEEWGNALSGNVDAQDAFNAAIADGMTVEDAFTEALAACGDETERSQILTDALTAAYGEAGQAYQDANEPLIEYRQAMSDLQGVISDVGTGLMPIVSAIVGSLLPGLSSITPIIKDFGESFAEAFSAGNLTGAGEQIGQAITSIASEIVSMIPEFISAGIEIIGGIAVGIAKGAPDLITSVVGAVTDSIPTIIESAIEVAQAVVEALPEIVQSLVDAIPTIIQMISDVLPETVDVLIEGFVSLFTAVVEAIPEIIESLVEAAPTIITSIVEALVENVDALIQGFVDMFMAVVESIPVIIETLVPMIPEIVTALIEALIENLPAMVEGFVRLFLAFVTAIPQIIAALVPYIPEIVSGIVEALIESMPVLIQGFVDLFMAFVDALPEILSNIAAEIPGMVEQIGQWIINQGETIKNAAIEIGGNLVRGIWDGISSLGGWLQQQASGFFNDFIGGVKSFFGIESPSKLMRDEIGKYLGEGMSEGIPIGFDVNDSMRKINSQIMSVSMSRPSTFGGYSYSNLSNSYNLNLEGFSSTSRRVIEDAMLQVFAVMEREAAM